MFSFKLMLFNNDQYKPRLRMFQQCTKVVSFHFSFTQIPGAEGRVFEWNPCTPFSTDVSGCNNVTVR